MAEVNKEEGSLAPCSIGKNDAASKCHVIFYAKKKGFKCFGDFAECDKKLLVLRSESKLDENSTICFHHEAIFLNKYQSMQKKCCNPFKKKNHNVKAGLRIIDNETAAKLCVLKEKEEIDIKPGQKLCPRCMSAIKKKQTESSSSQSEQDFTTLDEIEPAIDNGLSSIGVTPLKRRQVSNRDKPSYAKRKISEAQSLIGKQIAAAVGINYDEQPSISNSGPCNNCADLDTLIEELKEKCKVSNRKEKVQILTLVPRSWTIKDTATAFDVSERMVKQARKLKTERGILAFPTNRQGTKLSAEVVQKVHDFFEDDEFSRLCPGKKDCVPVRISGTKTYKQKRLLLCNLREMYRSYQNLNGPEIGFSKFCELRPKWCVTVGSAGMHSVCVCTLHQNVKLMLTGASINEDYKELLSKAVCSLENKECMLHRCENCPGPEGVEAAISTYFEDNDPEELIAYKQWIHTDRDTLETKQLPTDEYVEEIAAKMWNLSCHHYIAKHQSQHLKALKSDLKDGEFIILMDFAENYSFIVQDAVQGFHWDNSQATVHPFVVYCRENEEVQCVNLCVISDCLRHNTLTVHVFIKKVVNYLKTKFAKISHIHYFSDGSAAQYKNFKNFLNLCHHEEDFGMQAEWNFFGTSHGKSPCDGIGGTTKRLAARASLQRPYENQILTPKDLFNFCNENINGIKFFFISKGEVEEEKAPQEERFQQGHTLAGTRENHHFLPINITTIQVSRVSNDAVSFLAKISDAEQVVKVRDLQSGQYVACIYDKKWWIGNVCETSVEQKDAFISFMHPQGPASSFYWPLRRDTCWIPEQHIIGVIEAPSVTSSRRQYSFPEKVLWKINDAFGKMK